MAQFPSVANITNLWLHQNELSGSIPDLSALTSLTSLHLASNGFTGGIPSELGNLTNLSDLSLCGTDLDPTATLPAALESRRTATPPTLNVWACVTLPEDAIEFEGVGLDFPVRHSTFPVRGRPGATGVKVSWWTVNGTATGEDYTGRSEEDPGSVTIPANTDSAAWTSTAAIRVPTLLDGLGPEEGDESFTLKLEAAGGALIVRGSATGTIVQPLPPARADRPQVHPVDGSATSLLASWTPVVGRPPIAGYDVQYRKKGETGWLDGLEDAAFSEAAITGLEKGQEYEVRVRAGSAAGEGPWSRFGEGTTHSLAMWVESAPEMQDGEGTPFKVVYEFSEAVTVTQEATSLTESFFVGGRSSGFGEATSARRLGDDRIEVTFTPNDDVVGAMTISVGPLPCTLAGAICSTVGGVELSHGLVQLVPGPDTPVVMIQAPRETVQRGEPAVFEVRRVDPDLEREEFSVNLVPFVEGVVPIDPVTQLPLDIESGAPLPTTVDFNPGPLTASFTVNGICPDDLCRARTGVPVRFTDTSTGPVASRRWDFGDDGGGARQVALDRAWDEPGFYTVSLIVADSQEESTASRTFLVEAGDPAGTCVADRTTLCLQRSRFAARMQWWTLDGTTGDGTVVREGTDDSGMFWFFENTNWEALIKVLDGCALNGHHWVFGALTTDVGYRIEVTDTANGQAAVWEFRKESGSPAPALTDSAAFPDSCEPGN